MSFYVTLPSNSSSANFKNNTKSNYHTSLLNPIRLEGEWEVAIVKMNYRYAFDNIVGYIDIFKEHDAEVLSVPLKYDKEDSAIEIFKLLKVEIESNVKLNSILEIVIEDEEKEKFRTSKRTRPILNKDIQGLDGPQLDLIEFEKIVNGKLKIIISNDHYIRFRGTIKNILKLNKRLYSKEFIYDFTDEHVQINEAFFIYTDIIEDQIVGDTKAKLLDTISIKGSAHNEAVSIDIQNPNYVNLSLKEFSNIYISIKDSFGDSIRFSNLSKVIIKLHFRPKKYEHI